MSKLNCQNSLDALASNISYSDEIEESYVYVQTLSIETESKDQELIKSKNC